MRQVNAVDVLNRLLAIEYRSFAMYLAMASPWTHPGDEGAVSTLHDIVTDQKAMARRIAAMIFDRNGQVEPSAFPMEFTDTQLLSLDYLLTELLHYQRQDIAAIERRVAELASDRQAQELAQEVLGSERAHLEALEALAKQPA